MKILSHVVEFCEFLGLVAHGGQHDNFIADILSYVFSRIYNKQIEVNSVYAP